MGTRRGTRRGTRGQTDILSASWSSLLPVTSVLGGVSVVSVVLARYRESRRSQLIWWPWVPEPCQL